MAANLVNLAGKTALITGASSGIGEATAILFKKLGATVLATGRNNAQLEKLSTKLSSLNTEGHVHTITADLTVNNDVKKIINYITEKLDNKLDVLINNAGVLESGTIETGSMEQYDRIMNINLRAIVYLTKQIVPFLTKTKGSIVNISSVNGIRSFPGVLAYNISKAGLDQFTRCVALELAAKGIRVNAVNPGVTISNLHRRSGMNETDYQAFLLRAKETHAMGRPGTTDEVAATIAFLASDAASFITGASVPVDGGRHAMCPR